MCSGAEQPHPSFLVACLLAAVVFGRVTEGMEVVKKMEVMGSKSGKPKQSVVIADCGQVSVTLVARHLVQREPSIFDMQNMGVPWLRFCRRIILLSGW